MAETIYDKWCSICGEDEGEFFIREGVTVCNYHRSMIDGGYSLADIQEEEDEREADDSE